MDNPVLDPRLLVYVAGASYVLNLFVNWVRKGAPNLPGYFYLLLSVALAVPCFWAAMVILTGGVAAWGQLEIAMLFLGSLLTAAGAQLASANQQSADTARAEAKGETPHA